jgi:hypothetical protein
MKKTLSTAMFLLVAVSFGQTIEKATTKKKTVLQPEEEFRRSINLNDVTFLETGDDANQITGFTGIRQKTEYVGGQEALDNFVAKNFVVSKEMIDAKISGKVFISFVVEKDGSLSELKVTRDLGYEAGAELIRVKKLMPKWKSNSDDNKPNTGSYSITYVVNGND